MGTNNTMVYVVDWLCYDYAVYADVDDAIKQNTHPSDSNLTALRDYVATNGVSIPLSQAVKDFGPERACCHWSIAALAVRNKLLINDFFPNDEGGQ